MLAFLLFTLLTLLPLISINGISIPAVLLLLPIIFMKNRVVDKKLLIYSALATAFLVIVHIPVLMANDNLTAKGVSFVLYPVIIFLIYSIALNVIHRTKKKTVVRLLKIFLIIQLLFCIIQITNVLNIRTILEPTFLRWQEINALKTTGLLEVRYRPFGTIGSPVYLAIIAFLFGKCLQSMTSRSRFYLIAIVVILLSGARIAIVMVLLFFVIDYVLKTILKYPIKSIIAIAMFIIAVYLAVNYVPFIKILFDRYVVSGNSISNDYSISYRMSMLNLLYSNPGTILFGGYGIEKFPAYVDSEIILRIMQLGIFGLMVIMGVYYYIFKRLKFGEVDNNIKQQSIFLVCCMLSSVVFTNLLLIQYILVSAAILKDKCGEGDY